MIQFNLLPDVKIQYIKTKRLKRLIMAISVLTIGVSVLLTALSAGYVQTQKKHISDLDKDIAAIKTELEAIPELSKILTVQNQLNALPALYDGRPAVTRLPDYLDQTTPVDVGLTELKLDFSLSSLEITGHTDNLEKVHRYVNTIKSTAYKVTVDGSKSEATKAFSDVVMSKFGRDKDGASFTITMTFDPVIFDGTKEVELVIDPSIINRATQPGGDLFDGQAQTSEDENGTE